jgi:hypothetical protein
MPIVILIFRLVSDSLSGKNLSFQINSYKIFSTCSPGHSFTLIRNVSTYICKVYIYTGGATAWVYNGYRHLLENEQIPKINTIFHLAVSSVSVLSSCIRCCPIMENDYMILCIFACITARQIWFLKTCQNFEEIQRIILVHVGNRASILFTCNMATH